MKKPDQQLQQHLQVSRHMLLPDLNCRYIPEEEMHPLCAVSTSSFGEIGNKLDEPMFSPKNAVKPQAIIRHEYSEDSDDASVCTEEEMVAIEQLTRLKSRRNNEKEDIECDSSSVNRGDYDAGVVTVSSKPASRLHESPQKASTHIFPQTSKNLLSSSGASNYSEEDNPSISKKDEDEDMISLTADFDERPVPKIRMLKEVYNVSRSSQSSHKYRKMSNPSRRKAVNIPINST